ncbi:universal stress protein [Solirubrobacter ginsenosidimutans]|uniref:Universal stress protein n=1 Tax=Solirubrobacter ginsenosidimutans TaxID=490573 RepID=A0A9X3S694_9ACTN|nr:universal stress protein [Solirubrobacter ginsenosidimutans]MDA0162478.1 universal stress protein [Solirubrobacter ginsenosidimutans]
MTFVVGFAPDGRGRAVLELAGMLARSAGEDLLVAAVVPSPWSPGPARVDAEYQAELGETAEAALSEARLRLPSDARFVVHHARSTPAGLIEVAEEADARLIVLGSASHGALGHVSLGSVSDRLVHSSPVPLALAPRGFRCRGGCPVRRVTAAFGGGDDSLVVAAGKVAADVGAALRVTSLAVRPRAPIEAGVGREGEDAIVTQWERDVAAALGDGYDLVIGRGESWEEALEDVDWADGDVLVVGSSSLGPVARVFLGSRSAKIVRHSPVPVVVVPR